MKKILLLIIFMLLGTTNAFSEDGIKQGDWGLTVLTPITSTQLWIGGLYHIQDSIAVKPGLYINRTESDVTDNTSTPSATTSTKGAAGNPDYGIQLSVDYYMPMSNNLYLYAGPQVQYTWGKYEVTYSDVQNSTESEFKRLLFGVRLGAQFMFNSHLGIFADIGLFYTKEDTTVKIKNGAGVITTDTDATTKSTFSQTSVIGIVLYF